MRPPPPRTAGREEPGHVGGGACRRVCQGPMSPHPRSWGLCPSFPPLPLSRALPLCPAQGLPPRKTLQHLTTPRPREGTTLGKATQPSGTAECPPGEQLAGFTAAGGRGRLVETTPGNRPWWRGPQIVESSQRGDAGTPGSAASGERD